VNTWVPTARERALRRRTQLFVPANRPDFLPKAAASNADAVILDLEDSVPSYQRPSARATLAPGVAVLKDRNPRLHVVVRLNADDGLPEDLDAAVAAGSDAVLVPKVESSETVRRVEALLDACGVDRIELQLLVETSRGILDLPGIAAAGDRVVAMMLGIEDLSTELELDPTSPDFDVRWAHGLLVCAARAHGLAPYGLLGSLANFRDVEALTRDAERARAFGYLGALCIHPAQVDVLNRAFSPTAEEVADAREVLAAMAEGERLGTSAVTHRGRMVDTPTAHRARRLIARAGEPD
jgi:citrate lyase subunit beta/citryl-CoA lyase